MKSIPEIIHQIWYAFPSIIGRLQLYVHGEIQLILKVSTQQILIDLFLFFFPLSTVIICFDGVFYFCKLFLLFSFYRHNHKKHLALLLRLLFHFGQFMLISKRKHQIVVGENNNKCSQSKSRKHKHWVRNKSRERESSVEWFQLICQEGLAVVCVRRR